MKKSLISVFAAIALLAAVCVAQAATVVQGFSWTGDLGYSMLGTMTYDDANSIISADGGGWDKNSLQSMSVSFYNPTSELLGTFVQVANGKIEYDWLTFGYNTATRAFLPAVYDCDMGWDDGNSDEYYLGYNDDGYYLKNADTYRIVDRGGVVVAGSPAVPEPMTIMLGIMGLASVAGFGKLRKSA